MKKDSVYERLKEMLKNSKGGFSILEEQIDVDLQVDFFELVNIVSKNMREPNLVLADEKILYDKAVSNAEKKYYLVELSNLEKPEAYRMIEKYVKKAGKDLKPWAILSFQHSRISLETSLLDEQQVFISTGLGGVGDKLRYFIAGKLKIQGEYTESQKKIINSEFHHYFETKDSVIEKIDFSERYFTVICLMPLQIDFNEVVKPAIAEINLYGNFIANDYLITNVKVLKYNEIETYFIKKENNNDE